MKNYPPTNIIVKLFHLSLLSSNCYFEKGPNCVTRPASNVERRTPLNKYGAHISVKCVVKRWVVNVISSEVVFTFLTKQLICQLMHPVNPLGGNGP